MSRPVIHARAEEKKGEHRSALTPTTAKALLDAGYDVRVERNPADPAYKRIFTDEEFEAAGATLVDTYSYKNAPADHVIYGLKELPEEETPLVHTHVSFMHCFKNQGGWDKVLRRFTTGGGTLLDLEFLQDESGRRVAAFGYHAGFAGAALAVKAWAWQLSHLDGLPLPNVKKFTEDRGYFSDEAEMLENIRVDVDEGAKLQGNKPKVFVMGYKGRCGSGAVDALEKLGITDIVKWDIEETSQRQGPYQEIADCDIFVNCIYLNAKIPPFIDLKTLASGSRRLSVVCDVSCDTTNPNNPIPIYTVNTTFDAPTVSVNIPHAKNDLPLSVISIDHLPSLLPREASEAFSTALLPTLLQLKDRDRARVWVDAKKLFDEKCALLP